MTFKRIIEAFHQGADRLMDVAAIHIVVRAIDRMMAREVMLFAGGASFFALMALFPAFAVGLSIYGLIFSAEEAAEQVRRLSGVLPPNAESFLLSQVSQLADVSIAVLTVQGVIALLIALFAAARGAKALIAGLNQIAGRGDIRNVLHFNLLAMGAVLAGGALLVISNVVILAVPNLVRPALEWLGAEGVNVTFVFNEWTTAAVAMIIALMLLYRYLMQRAGETSWLASLISACVATGIWLAISNGFTLYVSTIVNPSAYGSLGALIVFLLWIYWASYAVFFGGALAVEIDKFRGRHTPP